MLTKICLQDDHSKQSIRIRCILVRCEPALYTLRLALGEVMSIKQIVVAICLSVFFTASAYAQYPQGGCLTELESPNNGPGYRMTPHVGRIFCAPPGGTVFGDSNGVPICGIGQCVTDANNKDFCSRESGGLATIDTYGRAKCVGGCIPPHRNYCRIPQ